MFKKIALALASTALLTTPVVAQSVDRTSAPVAQGEGQFEDSAFPGWIWALLVAIGVTWIIIEDEDKDTPVSP